LFIKKEIENVMKVKNDNKNEKSEEKLSMKEIHQIFLDAKILHEKRSIEFAEIAKRIGKNIYV